MAILDNLPKAAQGLPIEDDKLAAAGAALPRLATAAPTLPFSAVEGVAAAVRQAARRHREKLGYWHY